MYTFLSDLQQDQQRRVQQQSPPPQNNESSAYWERAGVPQFQNPPGAVPPQVQNNSSQLSGSSMFSPFNTEVPQGSPSQLSPLQRENMALKQQLALFAQYIKQQQSVQNTQSVQSTGNVNGNSGGKRTTELLIMILLILFIAVLVVLFIFCRKITQQIH